MTLAASRVLGVERAVLDKEYGQYFLNASADQGFDEASEQKGVA